MQCLHDFQQKTSTGDSNAAWFATDGLFRDPFDALEI